MTCTAQPADLHGHAKIHDLFRITSSCAGPARASSCSRLQPLHHGFLSTWLLRPRLSHLQTLPLGAPPFLCPPFGFSLWISCFSSFSNHDASPPQNVVFPFVYVSISSVVSCRYYVCLALTVPSNLTRACPACSLVSEHTTRIPSTSLDKSCSPFLYHNMLRNLSPYLVMKSTVQKPVAGPVCCSFCFFLLCSCRPASVHIPCCSSLTFSHSLLCAFGFVVFCRPTCSGPSQRSPTMSDLLPLPRNFLTYCDRIIFIGT